MTALELNPAALEPMYLVLKRMNLTPAFLMACMANPEIDEAMLAALKLAEGRA